MADAKDKLRIPKPGDSVYAWFSIKVAAALEVYGAAKLGDLWVLGANPQACPGIGKLSAARVIQIRAAMADKQAIEIQVSDLPNAVCPANLDECLSVPIPTPHPPGSAGKKHELAMRVLLGQELWHPDDAKMDCWSAASILAAKRPAAFRMPEPEVFDDDDDI